MNIVFRAGLVALSIVGLSGCGSLSFDEPAPTASRILIVPLGHVRGCRVVTQVVGESSAPPNKDLYMAAMEQIRAKAAEQSANRLVLQSYQIQSNPAGNRAIAIADAYACPTSNGGE